LIDLLDLTQLGRHPLPNLHMNFDPNLGAHTYANPRQLNSITEPRHAVEL